MEVNWINKYFAFIRSWAKPRVSWRLFSLFFTLLLLYTIFRELYKKFMGRWTASHKRIGGKKQDWEREKEI